MHAHIEIQSQDCDGRLSRSYVMTYADRAETLRNHAPTGEGSYVIAGEFYIDIHDPTEEGYCDTQIEFCEEAHCADAKPTYRDHRAESMGY